MFVFLSVLATVIETPAALSIASAGKAERRVKGPEPGASVPFVNKQKPFLAFLPDISRYLPWVTWPSLAAREAGKVEERTM